MPLTVSSHACIQIGFSLLSTRRSRTGLTYAAPPALAPRLCSMPPRETLRQDETGGRWKEETPVGMGVPAGVNFSC
jgi:hypothetical protein